MNVLKPFLVASLAFLAKSATAQDIQTERIAEINEILGSVRGDYTRQDGLYHIVIPGYNTNGEDLSCIVIKDTTIVYNLQQTPQAAGSGIDIDCNWAPQQQGISPK